MSYQQFPPAGEPTAPYGAPQPTVQQPAVPFGSTPQPGKRSPALIGLGALALVAGVGGGIAMLAASGSTYDDGVTNLARAPIGCTTSLEFEQTGTFTVYVETVGTIDDLRGDCPNVDADYEYDGDGLPDVDVVITNEDGDEIDLDDDESKSYDAAGAVGSSIGAIVIEDAGTYLVTVTSDEEDFVVAIGKDPKGDADSLTTNAYIALGAGVVVGGLLLLLGLRRKGAGPATGAPAGASQQPAYAPAPQAYPPAAAPGYAPPPTAPAPPTPPAPPTGGPQWPAPPAG